MDSEFFKSTRLPNSAESASVLLDANIKAEAFKRDGNDDWYSAIERRAVCRIPGYLERFSSLCTALDIGQKELNGRLSGAAEKAARGIEWGDHEFGARPLAVALKGGPMLLHRAVMLVTAFNTLVEEIKAGDTESLPPDALKFGSASIAFCGFYFYGMRAKLDEASATLGADRDLAQEIAIIIGQPVHVVKELFGEQLTKKKQTQADTDRATRSMGSYRTLRAILKCLAAFPALNKAIDNDREQWIQRVHVNCGRKTCAEDEIVREARRITRPPYNWDSDPHRDGEHYPPDVVVPPGWPNIAPESPNPVA